MDLWGLVTLDINEETKTCNKCKKALPLTSFSNCSGGNYLRPECKQCGYKLAKERKAIRDKYGSPPDDYRCPICNRSSEDCEGEGGKRASAWVVDHCHIENKFRGWLCHKCNRGIGAFADSVEILNRAIEYLRKEDD